jgi:hypothetical protein
VSRPEAEREASGGSQAAGGKSRRPILLVIAEDFTTLMEPLRWLDGAGYDVRACLGPLAADRWCGLFEGGCDELAGCDLLITNDLPREHRGFLGGRHEVVREARMRREEMPIVVLTDELDGLHEARHLRAVTVSPRRRSELLTVVEALAGPAAPPAAW